MTAAIVLICTAVPVLLVAIVLVLRAERRRRRRRHALAMVNYISAWARHCEQGGTKTFRDSDGSARVEHWQDGELVAVTGKPHE